MSSGIPHSEGGIRSKHDNRQTPSRPTTPLRPSSRLSLRESGKSSLGGVVGSFPDVFEPAFAELSDSLADLEVNMMHLQLMHESLSRFGENFASFLYGIHMNAFCVDFPEAPIPESFRRTQDPSESLCRSTTPENPHPEAEEETTFMTIDTTFIENPTTSSKLMSKSQSSTSLPTRGHNRGSSISGQKYATGSSIHSSYASGYVRSAKSRGA